jgi:hypothetical protein
MSSNEDTSHISPEILQDKTGFIDSISYTLRLNWVSLNFMINHDTLWDLFLGSGLFGIVFVCFTYASIVIITIEALHIFEDLIELLRTYSALWFMILHLIYPLSIASMIFCSLRFYITLLLSFPLSKLSFKSEVIDQEDMADEKFQFPLEKHMNNSVNGLFYDAGLCTVLVFGACFFSWIPFIDIFTYVLFIFVQIYQMARPFLQIVFLRQGMSDFDIESFQKSNRYLVFGIGLCYTLNFFIIPVIGWYAAPSCITIMITKILQEKKTKITV